MGRKEGEQDSIKRDIELQYHVNSTDAVRGITDLQRKMELLNSILDRGDTLGEGFLTSKQLFTARKLIDEMQTKFTSYHSARMRMEDQYTKKVMQGLNAQRAFASKADDVRARGGSANVQQYYSRRAEREGANVRNTFGLSEQQYRELQDSIRRGKVSQEGAAASLARRHPNLARMDSTISHMRTEMMGLPSLQSKLGGMHERDRGFGFLERGVRNTLMSAGAALSIGGAVHRLWEGGHGISRAERDSSLLGQRMGDSYGYTGDDRRLRRQATQAGLQNGYDAYETLQLQNIIASGGLSSGNYNTLLADTMSTQKFARSYGVDAGEMATSGAAMQKLGIYGEGEMQRFANLIGGAVSKSSMQGREGEMLRSTAALVKSVGDRLPNMDKRQMGSIVGFQAELGASIPGLRGERGAQVLSGMNNAMANSSNEMDIIMGKGWKPGYTGIAGSLSLEMKQESGLSDPSNLQEALRGMDYVIPPGTDERTKKLMKYKILKDQFGVGSMQTAKAMDESGFLKKVQSGKVGTAEYADELEKMGLKDEAKRARKFAQTNSNQRNQNDARNISNQFDISETPEKIATNLNSAWSTYVPTMLQLPLQIGAGMMISRHAAPMARSGLQGLKKLFGRNIDGVRGPGLRGLFNMGAETLEKRMPNMYEAMSGPASRAGSFLGARIGDIGAQSRIFTSAMGTTGESLAASGGRLASGAGKLLGGAGKLIGGKLPVIGGVIEYGLDRMMNPETNSGRSAYRAIGGTIGAGLGLLGAGALGVGTGGAGFLAGAAITTGASAAGSSAGDWLYSAINGKGDLEAQAQADGKDVSTDSVNAKSINADTIKLGDKDLAQIAQKDNPRDYKKYSADGSSNSNTQVIKLEVSGEVKGGTPEKQGTLMDSIKDFFTKKSPQDLSKDTERK